MNLPVKSLAAACAILASSSSAFAQPPEVNVRMNAQNKSGETGTAKLTPEGDQTRVDITLKGQAPGASQPAHIHEGTCAKLNPKPKYGLANVVDGKSSTLVPVSEKDLLSGKKLAINVHKSAEDIKTYVSCGDIKASTKSKR
jgi:Cu/Zn superoxide dismutase